MRERRWESFSASCEGTVSSFMFVFFFGFGWATEKEEADDGDIGWDVKSGAIFCGKCDDYIYDPIVESMLSQGRYFSFTFVSVKINVKFNNA